MKQKNSTLTKILSFLVWIAGIMVSLAVGFALKDGTLSVPKLGIANVISGWIVIITTLFGVLTAIINSLIKNK